MFRVRYEVVYKVSEVCDENSDVEVVTCECVKGRHKYEVN